jgi:hypothetical protein
MTSTDPGVEIHRAVPELKALAATVRPDWPAADVSAAIAHAATIGMTWPQVLVALPRLMADPHARPAELVPDVRDPLRPRPAAPPDLHEDELNAARRACQAASNMYRSKETRNA